MRAVRASLVAVACMTQASLWPSPCSAQHPVAADQEPAAPATDFATASKIWTKHRSKATVLRQLCQTFASDELVVSEAVGRAADRQLSRSDRCLALDLLLYAKPELAARVLLGVAQDRSGDSFIRLVAIQNIESLMGLAAPWPPGMRKQEAELDDRDEYVALLADRLTRQPPRRDQTLRDAAAGAAEWIRLIGELRNEKELDLETVAALYGSVGQLLDVIVGGEATDSQAASGIAILTALGNIPPDRRLDDFDCMAMRGAMYQMQNQLGPIEGLEGIPPGSRLELHARLESLVDAWRSTRTLPPEQRLVRALLKEEHRHCSSLTSTACLARLEAKVRGGGWPEVVAASQLLKRAGVTRLRVALPEGDGSERASILAAREDLLGEVKSILLRDIAKAASPHQNNR